MIMTWLLFLLSLVVCRFFAGYDSRFQNGRYISIRHPKLRMFLIDETSFFVRSRRPKKDLNKMTVSGLVFYLYGLLTLVVSAVLYIAVPKTPVDPWEIETDDFWMYVDTLNEKTAAIGIWLFFLSVLCYLMVLMIQHAKTIPQKGIRVFTYAISVLVFVAVAFCGYEVIRELARCFI